MENPLGALSASVDRLHVLAGGLDDTQLVSRSYCDDWSIAQVLSHLGSGAVISRRSLQDVRAGTATPDDFNQSVWDEWNAKSPRAQADDALVADEALLQALETVDETERAGLTFPMGPLSLGFNDVVALRLNEHVFHTWDIAVMSDDAARLPDDATGLVVDNLSLIARFSGRANGQDRTIAVHTTGTRRTTSRCGSQPTEWSCVPGSPGSHPTSICPPRPSVACSTDGSTPTTHRPSPATPPFWTPCAPSSPARSSRPSVRGPSVRGPSRCLSAAVPRCARRPGAARRRRGAPGTRCGVPRRGARGGS